MKEQRKIKVDEFENCSDDAASPARNFESDNELKKRQEFEDEFNCCEEDEKPISDKKIKKKLNKKVQNNGRKNGKNPSNEKNKQTEKGCDWKH